MGKYLKSTDIKNQREYELDLLRVFALLAVILVHCSGIEKKDLHNIDLFEKIIIFLTSIVTWQVPVFVMISGRFFLDPSRNVATHKIIKAIKRLLVAFVFWNIIYQVHYILTGVYEDLNWKGIFCQILIGPYHFWFLYMLIGLYAITPFLRKITVEKKLMEYFIVLFFLFEFLTNYGVILPYIGEILSEILIKTNFHFALGYSGYYILGYYLYKFKPSFKLEIALYICGIFLAIFAGIVTVWKTGIEGYNGEWYTKYLYPNIIIEAVAVYVFFAHHIGKYSFSKRGINLINKLSEYSFGVYLIHALVNELVSYVGRQTLNNPLIRLPIVLILIYMISNVFIACVRKIPYIGKIIT